MALGKAGNSRGWAALPLGGILAALLMLISCAGLSAKMGDSAASRGDWDSAFRSYQSALARDPENAELRAKLENARESAAQLHRRKGVVAERERRFGDAILEFETALGYVEDSVLRARMPALREKKRLADAERALASARAAEAASELVTAQQEYDEAIFLNPELEAIVRPRLTAIDRQIDAAREISSRAALALERGDLDAAEDLSRESIEINAQNDLALSVLGGAGSERVAREAEAEARFAARDDEFDVAVERAREAESARSSDARRALVAELESSAATYYSKRARKAFRRGRFSKAADLYDLARRYGSDPKAFRREFEAARYEAEYHAGTHALEARNYGTALTHFRRAQAIRPSKELATLIRDLEPPDCEKGYEVVRGKGASPRRCEP